MYFSAIKDIEKKVPEAQANLSKARKDLEDATNTEIKLADEVGCNFMLFSN